MALRKDAFDCFGQEMRLVVTRDDDRNRVTRIRGGGLFLSDFIHMRTTVGADAEMRRHSNCEPNCEGAEAVRIRSGSDPKPLRKLIQILRREPIRPFAECSLRHPRTGTQSWLPAR